jgi:hypothetical protein
VLSSLVVLAGLAGLVGLGVAHAPQAVALSSLEVDLWPEYDRPGVLVIYRATLAPGVDLPGVVELRIPAAAGAPNAVAERRADGRLVSLTYGREVEGEWAKLTFTASFPVVQIEYYDPRLERDGAERSFTFTYAGDHQVGGISFSVQQPDLAQELSTVPASTRIATGADGLTYHSLALPGTDAGEVVELKVVYEKVSDRLSVETIIRPPPPPPPAAAAGGTRPSPLVIAIALVAVAAMIGLLLFLRRSPRAASVVVPGPAAKIPPADAPGRSGRGEGEPLRTAAFCTGCGARAGSRDRFCHACGAPLATSSN